MFGYFKLNSNVKGKMYTCKLKTASRKTKANFFSFAAFNNVMEACRIVVKLLKLIEN